MTISEVAIRKEMQTMAFFSTAHCLPFVQNRFVRRGGTPASILVPCEPYCYSENKAGLLYLV